MLDYDYIYAKIVFFFYTKAGLLAKSSGIIETMLLRSYRPCGHIIDLLICVSYVISIKIILGLALKGRGGLLKKTPEYICKLTGKTYILGKVQSDAHSFLR